MCVSVQRNALVCSCVCVSVLVCVCVDEKINVYIYIYIFIHTYIYINQGPPGNTAVSGQRRRCNVPVLTCLLLCIYILSCP